MYANTGHTPLSNSATKNTKFAYQLAYTHLVTYIYLSTIIKTQHIILNKQEKETKLELILECLYVYEPFISSCGG